MHIQGKVYDSVMMTYVRVQICTNSMERVIHDFPVQVTRKGITKHSMDYDNTTSGVILV